MEQAMMEMERDFAGMDESNPDPRALARMMRKMSDLTGEKMPGTMEEMIQRMEAGEDPEKLEEEYGEALETSIRAREEKRKVQNPARDDSVSVAGARNAILRSTRWRTTSGVQIGFRF